MRKTLVFVFALAAATAMPAFAQSTNSQPSDQSNPGMTQPANPAATQPPDQNSPQAAPDARQPAAAQPSQSDAGAVSSQAGQTLMGTISSDGKTFSSNGTTYNVSNPNSVKAYANQPITVGYEMDANNSIHITKVMLTKPQQ